MFRKRIKLFRLFGFDVGIHISWLIVAALVLLSLAMGFFPQAYPHLPERTYWLMGVIATILFFASIIFHEFCHSLVARRYGLPMRGITLFLLGGIAEMGEEPKRPKVELLTALAGPAASVALGFGFIGLGDLGESAGWPLSIVGVLIYLGRINWLLAIFNMLPAFPLDGGRVLRAALWSWKKDLRSSTRIASHIGGGFGLLLILLGIFNLFMGSPIGGLWLVLIGLFLRGAAQASYQQVLVREVTEGKKVGDIMDRKPIQVTPSLSLRRFVDDYVLVYHFDRFPVVEDGGELLGCLDLQRVKMVPESRWDEETVSHVAHGCDPLYTIDVDADLVAALDQMSRGSFDRLLAVQDGHLEGVLDRHALERFITVRLNLTAS